MPNYLSMAEAVADAARQINGPHDMASTLRSIAFVAAHQMPEFEHVSVSIAHGNGHVETVAATDDLVRRLDQLQYELGEGPCLHSLHTAEVTAVEDFRRDQRWPRFVPEATKLGVRSQLAVRLFADEQTIGGLNMYSTVSDTISEETRHMADLFATHAAIALGRARREDQISTALESRAVIGQAIGIVMERYTLDANRAFAFLRRVSSTSNLKLRDVAEQLVDEANKASRTSN